MQAPSTDVLDDVPPETRHEVLPYTPRIDGVASVLTPRSPREFTCQASQLRPQRCDLLLPDSSQPRLDEVLRGQAGELEIYLNKFLDSQNTLASKLSSQQERLIRLLEDLSPSRAGTRLRFGDVVSAGGLPSQANGSLPMEPRMAEDLLTVPFKSGMAADAHDDAGRGFRPSLSSVISLNEQISCRAEDGDSTESLREREGLNVADACSREENNTPQSAPDSPSSRRVVSDLLGSTKHTVWAHMLKHSGTLFYEKIVVRHDFTKLVVYEVSMMFVIMLNAAYIGWSVQHALTTTEVSDEPYYGPYIFLFIYLADLMARLWFERMHFFKGKEKYWNLFDTFVVLVMIVELALGLYFRDSDYKDRSDLGMLRMFRILRLLRFVKVVQYFFEFSREFRMLVYASQKACRAFFWMLVALGFMVYFVAIVMTQGALGACQHGGVLASTDAVCENFGSLDRAVLNLYLAIFGGIVWGELEAAAENMGLVYPIVIIIFVSFMHVILLNAITGIVLEIHNNIAHTEKLTMIEDTLEQKRDYVRKMQDIFAGIDINSSGGISIEEFQHAVADERMCALLAKMDVEVNDACQLFRMLDRDETGAIEIDEFIFGLMHMKGDAKAVDVLKLQIESEWMMHNISVIRQNLDKMCGNPSRLSAAIPEARSATNSRHQTLTSGQSVPTMGLRELGVRQAPAFIENTEERALTLRDLEGIVATIEQDCVQEDWKDMLTLKRLKPQDVNLYHFNWHCICPATAIEGVELRGLTQTFPVTAGQKVIQMDAANNFCLAEGISQGQDTAGMHSVVLTKGRFQNHDEAPDSSVYIDDINVGTPMEVIAKMSLSYKEIINPTPTKAVWFCSHWWGEPVADFVACCQAHAKLRQISIKFAAYWVCAYANRQHDIHDDICCDPDNSAFRRAMKAAEGVLLVLDSMATPFGRIWCDFELYHTLSDEKPLDIVTIAGQGSKRGPQLLSQIALPGETIFTKARREGGFPIDLLVSGMRARLEDGAASHPADKPRILTCMARNKPRMQQTSPAETGVQRRARASNADADLRVALERANSMLHSYLALAAWPQAVKKACVQDFDPQSPGTLCLPQVLARASHLQHFNLSLAHLKELQDADLELLSRSFPVTVYRIHLCLEGCANITDAGLTSLAEALPAQLQELSLDCVGCIRISDVGLKALAMNLPRGLKRLDLFFATCQLIGTDGIIALSDWIPSGLRHFQARFEGTQVSRKFDSVRELTKFVASTGRPRPKKGSLAQSVVGKIASMR